MKNQRKTQGFAIVETLLVLAILAIIGYVGYTVFHSRNATNKLNEQSAAQQVAVPKNSNSDSVPSAINNTTDLDQAANALNADNPNDNSSDLQQLDSQSSDF